MVKLKNGSSVDESFVCKTMTTLKSFGSEIREVILFELFHLCRDPECELLLGAEKVLQEACLVDENGAVTDDLRNIILSAVKTEGLNVWLMDPIEQGT
jgi:hypothetical protein